MIGLQGIALICFMRRTGPKKSFPEGFARDKTLDRPDIWTPDKWPESSKKSQKLLRKSCALKPWNNKESARQPDLHGNYCVAFCELLRRLL